VAIVASVLAEVASIAGVAFTDTEDAGDPSIASRKEHRLIPKLIVSLTDIKGTGEASPVRGRDLAGFKFAAK